MDFQHAFLVPVAHALLYGVVKAFVALLLRAIKGAVGRPVVLDSKTRQLLSARAKDVVVSADFGRKYTDVVVYR